VNPMMTRRPEINIAPNIKEILLTTE